MTFSELMENTKWSQPVIAVYGEYEVTGDAETLGCCLHPQILDSQGDDIAVEGKFMKVWVQKDENA